MAHRKQTLVDIAPGCGIWMCHAANVVVNDHRLMRRPGREWRVGWYLYSFLSAEPHEAYFTTKAAAFAFARERIALALKKD